jgi:hypothetical protein
VGTFQYASSVTNVSNKERKVNLAFCKKKLEFNIVQKHPILIHHSLLGSLTHELLEIYPLLPKASQRR